MCCGVRLPWLKRKVLLSLLEQAVKRSACVARGSRSRCRRCRSHLAVPIGGGRWSIARYRDARFEELTFIGHILSRDPHRNGLQTLKTCGRFKVLALLTTMQCRIAFRTSPLKIDIRRQGCGAIEASRGGHRLHQPRQTGTRYVNRRARSLRAWAIITPIVILIVATAGVLIAVLPVFAFTVHRLLVGSLLVCRDD